MTKESPNSLDETAAIIAQELGETDPIPQEQIRRIVERLGAEAALTLLRETLEIEAQGGMLLPDRSRRRTPGGVFFYLVRSRTSKEDQPPFGLPLHHLCYHRAQKSRSLRRLRGKIA